MKKNKSWVSIVESILLMVIITIWVVGMYTLYTNSVKVVTSTQNRIKATSIAREWIEIVNNIRDTNWMLFWANNPSCWNAKDYDSKCITNNWAKYNPTSMNSIHITPGSYITIPEIDGSNPTYRWLLNNDSFDGHNQPTANLTYSNPEYRDYYEVWTDGWLYIQWWTWAKLMPIYTREIQIQYIDEDWNIISPSNDGDNPDRMKVTSIVRWFDSASKNPNHEVKLTQNLTNWQK